MALADRLSADPKSSQKSAFERWIDNLPAADQEALMNAFRNPDWSNMAILRAVSEEGYGVSKETVAKVRRKVTSGAL